MEYPNLQVLEDFTEASLPDLDTAVFGALELLSQSSLPKLSGLPHQRPLVVGSVNAESTGRIVFDDRNAVFANESTYQHALERAGGSIDGAFIISASGGKHAAPIAEELKARGIDTFLLTNNPGAPAAAFVEDEQTILFPKNREPYTYNTSTYLSMILASTEEDPLAIHSFLTKDTMPRVPDTLSEFDAFFITVPPVFSEICDMIATKFDELFGARVSGRVFTTEAAKHAKTVVPSESELFIALGEPSSVAPREQSLHLPLPQGAGYGAALALAYFTVGCIQKQHPAYFKDYIASYAQEASRLFGENIPTIVE